MNERILIPLLLAALTLSGSPPPHLEAQGLTRAEVRAIDDVFSEWSDPAGPGAAVAVTRDGRVVYSQGYGSAQLEYRIPVTPTTIFHIASISKQFTTFAVALLARDGKLHWDDEVHRHLPELPDLGQPVTLRQLASHTSGVRDQWQLLVQAGWRMDDVITRDQIMRMMSRQRELNFEPGSEYLYSNMGYSLLAEVVERVSGESFGDFLEERVFLPLGMHRTHVHMDHTRVVPGRAYSYSRPSGDGGEWRNAVLSYANQGATSLFTTVEDLGRWIAEYENPTVGDRSLWDEMRQPAVLNSGEAVPYGLGLAVSEYRGLPTVGHGGADAGFRTNLMHFPEERLGVVVFGNAASFNAAGAARRVAEVVLGDRLGPEESTALEPRPNVQVENRILDQLAGRYRLQAGTMITIQRTPQGLVADVGTGSGSRLVAESETEFWVNDMDGRLTFQRDDAGRVEGFTFRHPGGNETARRVTGDPLTEAELEAYAGSYYSPELDTTYRLRVQDGELVIEHQRQPDATLFPLGSDRFGGSAWYLSTAVFSRDGNGEIDGFRITGGRVRNLWFERVEEAVRTRRR